MSIYIVNGERKFTTLEHAKAYANAIYARTGAIVSIVERVRK